MSAFEARLEGVLLPWGSNFSIASLFTAFCVGTLFLAARHWRRRRRVAIAALARALFSTRLLASRSTAADIGYFVVNTLATAGFIGWACLSTGATASVVSAGLNERSGRRRPCALPNWRFAPA